MSGTAKINYKARCKALERECQRHKDEVEQLRKALGYFRKVMPNGSSAHEVAVAALDFVGSGTR